MGVISGSKPPDKPWTVRQSRRLLREYETYMRERTKDRSDDSVTEGIATLKELVATARRCGMIVQIAWKRGGDGRTEVNTNPSTGRHADSMNGEWNTWDGPGSAKIIMLDRRGLHYVVPDIPEPRGRPCPGHWESLPEDAYSDIVRHFQLFPDDLEEIIKLLRMD